MSGHFWELPESNEVGCRTRICGSSRCSRHSGAVRHSRAPVCLVRPGFFLILANFWVFKQEAKCSKERNGICFNHLSIVSHLGAICVEYVLIRSTRAMPNLFQNIVHHYKLSFALGIFCVLCVSSLSTSMPLSADDAPPPRRIIAFICMNPDCQRSFSNLYGYDQHRTHARNADTLCASLTMRREIIATRRAGVTTSVVKEIAPKGAHHTIAHDWKDAGTRLDRFDTHKKIRSS